MCIILNINLSLIRRNLQNLNKIILNNLYFITNAKFTKIYAETLILIKQLILIISFLIKIYSRKFNYRLYYNNISIIII